jgi:acetylornithine deacetylase/succinyl-diaminopimelate desuccinylase-like protein
LADGKLTKAWEELPMRARSLGLPCLVLATSICCGAPANAQGDPLASNLIQKSAQANFGEFFEFLSLPNDAVVPADIQKNADWLEVAFRKRGFVTRQLPNSGKPLVYAEYQRKVPNAKTVLFYMHFDGQPVVPAQWSQKSPWIAVLKQRRAAAGPPPLATITPSRASAAPQWEEIDQKRLQEDKIDPEWRIFARASSDDKGPIMMFLTAFDALKAAGLEPAINVKVLLDGEEEKGSPNIGVVATAHRELLRADGIVINDGPLHISNQPTIIFGNRGNTVVKLTVYGPKSNLHSGHYGNYVPNPAQRLAALLASMKGDDGRVTIAGYYDSVKLTDAERRIMAEVPDDEAEIKARVGIAQPEAVGRNLQEALQYPSLNIRGMESAAIGDKGANIIPSQAAVELDLRTTPGATPSILTGLVEAHVRAKGYHLTAGGPPTDEERAKHDQIASLVVARGSAAAFTQLDSPLGAWAQTSLGRTFAEGGEAAKTVRIRMMGGSVPTDKLVEALDLPFVIVPLVNPDNNQHSFDENLRLGHFLDGTRVFTGLLRSPF